MENKIMKKLIKNLIFIVSTILVATAPVYGGPNGEVDSDLLIQENSNQERNFNTANEICNMYDKNDNLSEDNREQVLRAAITTKRTDIIKEVMSKNPTNLATRIYPDSQSKRHELYAYAIKQKDDVDQQQIVDNVGCDKNDDDWNGEETPNDIFTEEDYKLIGKVLFPNLNQEDSDDDDERDNESVFDDDGYDTDDEDAQPNPRDPEDNMDEISGNIDKKKMQQAINRDVQEEEEPSLEDLLYNRPELSLPENPNLFQKLFWFLKLTS
jgi:hypothetical protein